MKPRHVCISVFIFLLACLLLPAQNPQEPRDEFFFAKEAGEKGRPNRCMLEHASRQA